MHCQVSSRLGNGGITARKTVCEKNTRVDTAALEYIKKINPSTIKLLDVQNYDINMNVVNKILLGGKKMIIQDFIKIHSTDFDAYEARPDWKGYKVYLVWLKAHEGACVGYPQYALEKDNKIRLSTLEETIAIIVHAHIK